MDETKFQRPFYSSQKRRRKQAYCKPFLSCLRHYKMQINWSFAFKHLPSFLCMKLFVSWDLLVLCSSFSFKWGYNDKRVVRAMAYGLVRRQGYVMGPAQYLKQKAYIRPNRKWDLL